MTGQRIAVTGASGAIGSRLIALLKSRGFSVVALQRDAGFTHGEDIDIRPFTLADSVETMAEHLHDVDQLVHLAATAGALRVPSARFGMVRLGIGVYGLSPDDTPVPGLTPAMTLSASARSASVARVPPARAEAPLFTKAGVLGMTRITR